MKADVPPTKPTRLERKRKRASERTRRYRERLNSGCVIVRVPVSHAIIGLLLDTRWLSETNSESRDQIGLAIANMLTNAVRDA